MSRKLLTDEVPQIDLARLRAAGVLWPGSRFTLRWRVGYADLDVPIVVLSEALELVGLGAVALDRKECFFGGEQFFFRCRCGHHARTMYLGDSLRCRRCANLSYRSQFESPVLRALRKARKIRDRIDGRGLFELVIRGKGSHGRTWQRQVAEFEAALAEHGRELDRVMPKWGTKLKALTRQVHRAA